MQCRFNSPLLASRSTLATSWAHDMVLHGNLRMSPDAFGVVIFVVERKQPF
jgi:hypothetical protein